MVLSYMKNSHDIHLSHILENDILLQKLKTMILQHQIHGMSGQQNPAIINAAYNHHFHCKIVLIRKQQKQAVIRNLRTLFQIVPMIPEITI